ncbi:hypothetical protein, partial [Bifidobacterium merycicum]|uniref:hypothetical protein n=1 Tax=Bifidobacterium merycicum TaxID=78345 RepID=UPI001EE64552
MATLRVAGLLVILGLAGDYPESIGLAGTNRNQLEPAGIGIVTGITEAARQSLREQARRGGLRFGIHRRSLG